MQAQCLAVGALGIKEGKSEMGEHLTFTPQ